MSIVIQVDEYELLISMHLDFSVHMEHPHKRIKQKSIPEMELFFYYLILSNSNPTIISVSNADFFILFLSDWSHWNEKE